MIDVHILFRLKMDVKWGAWLAQSVKLLTLDFGSGHDLVVCEIKPPARTARSLLAILSPPLSAPPLLTHTCWLSLSQSEYT